MNRGIDMLHLFFKDWNLIMIFYDILISESLVGILYFS